jgi:hypothetical protein
MVVVMHKQVDLAVQAVAVVQTVLTLELAAVLG